MSKNTIEINDESIKKAYETLGIDYKEISKAEKEEDQDNEEPDGDDEEVDEKKKKLQKAIDDKRETLQKAQEALDLLDGKSSEPEDESSKIAKSVSDTLEKSFGEKFDALITLNKSLTGELGEVKENLEKSEERIRELEELPTGRKSITTESFIEKAFSENDETGKKMLSISQHKNEIQRMLIEKAGLNGDMIEKSQVDTFWKSEMEYYEATGTLRPMGIERLYKEHDIQIVK